MPEVQGEAKGDWFLAEALHLLRRQTTAERKALKMAPELERGCEFDAILPQGVDDLPGATGVVVKRQLTSEVVQFMRNYGHLKAVELSLRCVLFVTGEPVSVHTLSAISRLNEQGKIRLVVWGPTEMRALADKFPDSALAFHSEYRQKAVMALLNEVDNPRQEPIDKSDEQAAHITALGRAHKDNNLVLFMGSGCSRSAGFPLWDELLARLVRNMIASKTGEVDNNVAALMTFFKRQSPTSPIIVARFLRDTFGSEFADKVREALYFSVPENTGSGLLEELVRLCLPLRKGIGVVAVVTYNYDNCFEHLLTRAGVAHKVIMGESDVASGDTLPIYHVHGYLPRDQVITEIHRSALVLSEEAYHLQFTDPFSWVNLTQLVHLRDHVCLFVGFSLTDPNQRRLLEVAQQKRPGVRHYAIIKDHWYLAAKEAGDNTLEKYAGFFRGLEQASLIKLGIEPIWVKDHDAIPEIISAIRK